MRSFFFLNVGIQCYKILLELVLLHPVSFDALCLIFICFKILFDLLFQFLHWLFRASCFISMYLWIFQRWGLWWECVSNFPTCFDLFFCHLKCRNHSVSGSLPKGIALCAAIYSVCPWQEENSGASNVVILVQSLCLFLIMSKVNRCQFKLLLYSLFWFIVIGCQVMLAFELGDSIYKNSTHSKYCYLLLTWKRKESLHF